MQKRLSCTLAFVLFSLSVLLAQQPLRKRVTPPEKPPLKSAVTVIDLRNVTEAKKPPKRETSPTYTMRTMSGPRTPAASLTAAQMTEALRGAGISAAPANLYVSLEPSRLSVPGKGYLSLYWPQEVDPDRVEFSASSSGDNSRAATWASVVLDGVGIYVLDFVLAVPSTPPGAGYQCVVQQGGGTIQIMTLRQTDEPMHVLLVVNQDASRAGFDDYHRSIGMHISRPELGNLAITWTLYRVDITKL
jgi:hypothetical protein